MLLLSKPQETVFTVTSPLMKNLDPHALPLQSINLIEASAGTGKSWTVTLLYLRLILEKNLNVEQILVVTFTDAATKELRDNIRNRIVDAHHAFSQDDYQIDDEYKKLIDACDDRATAILRLNRAKLSIDEAAIFTIHGFCQRSLSENAFEANLPFKSELLEDVSDISQRLTDDFWRRRYSNPKSKDVAPKSLLFKLHQKNITPDTLLEDISDHIGKPYLQYCGPDSKEVNAEKWIELAQSFQKILEQWQTDGEEVSQIVLEDKNLNKSKFNKATTARLCNEMNQINFLYEIDPEFIKNASKFKQSYVEIGTKTKCTTPEHRFFSVWENFSDLWEQLNNSADDDINRIRIELLEYLRIELPKEKQRLGVLSFDDLLLQTQQALRDNPQLAKDLCGKYPAALIDEFQDTDPIQYDIFSTIYASDAHQGVFLVGDPKQAIYSFRGGDIHTYLKAKADISADNQFTLAKNWRSHPDLINAFNALYFNKKNPFRDEGIEYVQVDFGNKTTDTLSLQTNSKPLRFWQFHSNEEKPDAESKRHQIAKAVAGDIATVLNDAQQNQAMIGDKKISGGDIAILVRSHTHAKFIKEALNARGITSVQSSRESIYQTGEADDVLQLLKAISEPQNEAGIRRALVTNLLGYKAQDLLDFQEDNAAWEAILTAFYNWHHQWRKQGLLPMMRSLMTDQKTHQKLLGYADGERRLSNLLQLAELIHNAERKQMLGMSGVIRWLNRQQDLNGSSETELRLESDNDLVKIVTIHKSKGLEYPIIYCPFVGMNTRENSDKIYTFHKDGKNLLEIGSPDADEHRVLKRAEESAEDTRLLYVALTRAKYQCMVVSFSPEIYQKHEKTAFAWLITDGKLYPSGTKKEVQEQRAEFFEAYNQNLQNLAQQNTNISLEDLPDYPDDLRYQAEISDEKRVARTFRATIKKQAHITSFSGLTADAHAETPDYDELADNRLSLAKVRDDEFPRGSTAGTALHEIFENLDFIKPVDEQLDVIDSVVTKYGFDKKHQNSAAQLIQESLNAEINNGFSLNQLNNDKRLDEMEFYLPLARLHIDSLKQIVFQHLPKDESEDQPWQLMRDAINSLYFEEIEGYLKGFIDLIFEHDGQYYLADYKSNSLPDYGSISLFSAMADSHYYLQYLLYSVALHRYLEQRIPDYDWDTHVGGVYYLFIRGMKVDAKTVASPESGDITELFVSENETASSLNKWGGVFFHKPSREMIEALDGLFVRISAEMVANG